MYQLGDSIGNLSELTDGFVIDPSIIDVGVSDGIAIEARYHLSAYCPSLYERLGILKPHSLNSAVLKRQAEFLAGRLLSQIAFKVLGWPAPTIAIGRDRSPVWPTGSSGSLSHTEGRCISAIVPDENAIVGVDIETIATGSTLEAIRERALDATERDLISRQHKLGVNILASLIFSAKETLFKALYPVVGKYFDFCSAQFVSFDNSNELCLRLTRSLHLSLPANTRFLVRFLVAENFVRTWLICHRGQFQPRPIN